MIVYGDFNCPYSRLASIRVDALRERGVDIEWRAVQHDADMPAEGVAVQGELADELLREVAEILELTADDEDVAYVLPDIRPNTADDCAAYAGLAGEDAATFRRMRFEEVWRHGPPARRGASAPEVAADWQSAWESVPRRMVPLLMSTDGRDVARGIEALERLRALLDG